MKRSSKRSAGRQKVQSAEVGAEVLKALGLLGRSSGLSQIAQAAAMPPAKAYRYLQALVASGFVAQDPLTSHYRLGFEALHLGLSALRQIDVLEAARDVMVDLNAELGETCSLAVWANHGPTVVKVVESPLAHAIVTRLGSVLPLLTSAAGLVFTAFLPPSETTVLLEAELARLGRKKMPGFDAASVRSKLDAVRRAGLGTVRGLNFPGVDALSVPIFAPEGRVAAALNMLGVSSEFDVSPEGRAAQGMLRAAERVSERMGFRAAGRPAIASVNVPEAPAARPPGRRTLRPRR